MWSEEYRLFERRKMDRKAFINGLDYLQYHLKIQKNNNFP